MGEREEWRQAVKEAQAESGLAQRLEKCRKARELIQERLLELASSGGGNKKREQLEEALRTIWALEHQNDSTNDG